MNIREQFKHDLALMKKSYEPDWKEPPKKPKKPKK